jgi:RNA 2',3'-cyclic 3'-phosphodiesterase
VPAFFLPLCSIGVFNSRGRPSVVWVGIGKGHPHLFALHRRIQDAVLSAGLQADLKPFHPHVTVGRARDISGQVLQPFVRSHAETLTVTPDPARRSARSNVQATVASLLRRYAVTPS